MTLLCVTRLRSQVTTPKIGIGIGLSPSRIGQVAVSIEESGADELWLAEDCFFAGGIAAAAAALAATEGITVGLGILPAVARNAAFTAMELAALAGMYPGRVVAGLGHGMAGWMRQVGAAPRSPLTALGEHLRAVRDLLAGRTVTLDGDYVRLDRVRLDHPPAVVPPVLAGVRLRPQVAAELAMPSSRAHLEPLGLADDVARLLEACGSPDELTTRLPDEWIDQLTIVGDPAQCAAKISEVHRAGAGSLVLALPTDSQLIREVISLLR